MNVSLTPELIAYVQSQVESGLYNNASEIVRDALRNKKETSEMLYQLKLERLRKALAPGLKDSEEGRSIEISSYEEFTRLINEHKND